LWMLTFWGIPEYYRSIKRTFMNIKPFFSLYNAARSCVGVTIGGRPLGQRHRIVFA
jgi:hypothetical protein